MDIGIIGAGRVAQAFARHALNVGHTINISNSRGPSTLGDTVHTLGSGVTAVTHRVLFVLLILAHERRRVVHVHITEHPTAQGTAQQVVEAFPWDEAPRYLLRDRGRIYGASFRQRVQHMGIEEVLIAPRSPWQNPYIERLIGSIRREGLDQVIILHERHLRRLLTEYFHYYHHWRTHRALAMDCPRPRLVQRPDGGLIQEVPEVGGLHHHYEWRAA